MNLTITIDIEAAIKAALAPEKLQPILDKHVTVAITTAIREATGYRSKFSETLKEQLATALPHGLAIDDVAKFQHVLNASMNRMVQECNANAVSAAMEKVVGDVMPDVPAVMKISELLQAAREAFYKEPHDAFFAHLEESESGGGWLYLDSNEDLSESKKYSADHRLAFTKDGTIYSLHLNDTPVTPASRPDVISRFEGILMSMYVGRTRLEVDMDEHDVSSAAEADYD